MDCGNQALYMDTRTRAPEQVSYRPASSPGLSAGYERHGHWSRATYDSPPGGGIPSRPSNPPQSPRASSSPLKTRRGAYCGTAHDTPVRERWAGECRPNGHSAERRHWSTRPEGKYRGATTMRQAKSPLEPSRPADRHRTVWRPGGSSQIFHPPMPNARQISETRIATTRSGAKYFTITT